MPASSSRSFGSARKRLKSSCPSVDGHADAMEERCEDTTISASSSVVAVVAHQRRLDVVFRELPEQLQRDVGDDLDVTQEWSLI